MIACFRKVQAWDHQSIVNEYRSFAGKKARALDEEFIQTYTPPRDILATAKRLGVASWVAVPYPDKQYCRRAPRSVSRMILDLLFKSLSESRMFTMASTEFGGS
jgi:hypothetical protein